MAEIVWSELAIADLEAIAEYIAVENPRAASEVVQRVLAHVDQLSEYPESGSRLPELGKSRYRQIDEPHCRTLYRHDGQRVFIVHVMRTERLLRKSWLPAE